MSATETGTGIFDRLIPWAEVDDAIYAYDVPLTRFCKHTGMARRNLQRKLETDEDAPGWVSIMLLVYERLPRSREFTNWAYVPSYFSNDESCVPTSALKRALADRSVSIARFARHIRVRESVAQRMVDPKQSREAKPWVRWVILMYDQWPETRTLDEPIHLPKGKWPGRPDDELVDDV